MAAQGVGGEGGGVDKAGGCVAEQVDEVGAAADESAEGAQGLAPGGHEDVDAVVDAKVFGGSPARGAQDAGGVGVVHHQDGVVGACEFDQVGQGREVSVHAEEAVGDDQTPAETGFAGEQVAEVVDVAVAVDVGHRAGEPAGVNDAAVVEPVTEDGVLSADKGGDCAQVGHVAGGKDEGRPGAEETGEAGFKVAVGGHAARDEAGGGGAQAAGAEGGGGGVFEHGMVGQTQVVVRTEEEEVPAVDVHAGALGAFDETRGAVEAAGLEVVQFG